MQCESVSPTLPNLAQLILGSGQRLKCDEVITYSHTVGVHLQNTQRVSKEKEKSHVQLYTLRHYRPLTTHIQKWQRQETGNKQQTQRQRTSKLSGVIRRAACADGTEPYCSNRCSTSVTSHLNKHFTPLWKKAEGEIQGKIFLPLLFFCHLSYPNKGKK